MPVDEWQAQQERERKLNDLVGELASDLQAAEERAEYWEKWAYEGLHRLNDRVARIATLEKEKRETGFRQNDPDQAFIDRIATLEEERGKAEQWAIKEAKLRLELEGALERMGRDFATAEGKDGANYADSYLTSPKHPPIDWEAAADERLERIATLEAEKEASHRAVDNLEVAAEQTLRRIATLEGALERIVSLLVVDHEPDEAARVAQEAIASIPQPSEDELVCRKCGGGITSHDSCTAPDGWVRESERTPQPKGFADKYHNEPWPSEGEWRK